MRILLSGGGTGGHINPAIAIADAFRNRDPKTEIAFCGTPNGMEATLVEKAGYPFYAIPMQGLQRKLTLQNIKSCYLTLQGYRRAKKLLHRFQPDLVIGTGGYVCYPLLRTAAKNHIFSAIHESNAVPGLTTRMLAPHMDCVLTNFDRCADQLPKDVPIFCVGNPLRQSFTISSPAKARAAAGIPHSYRHVLLSFGGSLGAEHLNDAILNFMAQYGKDRKELYHIHACGKRDYERIAARFQSLGLEAYSHLKLVDYLYDMPTQMCAADIVLSRSGALSLSEIAALHKPSILVPSPYVTDQHQLKNATVFQQKGAALLIEEKDLSADTIAHAVDQIISSKERYQKMACASACLAGKNVADHICTLLLNQYQQTKK